MDDMLETMYSAPGIGLAAIQVGVPKRVIVLDIAAKNEHPLKHPFKHTVLFPQELIGQELHFL